MLQKYEKTVWGFLLGAMALVTLWFTVICIYHIFWYIAYNEKALAKDVHWSVKEISGDRYLLQPNYHFYVADKTYEAESLLESPVFRNPGTAEQAIPQYAKQTWTVWYSSFNPAYTTLQKSFPIKDTTSTVLLWGVLIYFYWLRFHYAPRFYRNIDEDNHIKK